MKVNSSSKVLQKQQSRRNIFHCKNILGANLIKKWFTITYSSNKGHLFCVSIYSAFLLKPGHKWTLHLIYSVWKGIYETNSYINAYIVTNYVLEMCIGYLSECFYMVSNCCTRHCNYRPTFNLLLLSLALSRIYCLLFCFQHNRLSLNYFWRNFNVESQYVQQCCI